MGQVDALKMVEHIRTRLVDLAVSENYVRDSNISNVARKIWEGPGAEGGLVSELWVEGTFPGERSRDSLKSLSSEGLFPEDLCQHLDARDAFPADRKLYNHQSEALRKIAGTTTKEKPALIIRAGTALGKTEAFLLPMLADLWATSTRLIDGGMRCLILYPMNALIADQVERIYYWLQGQERLKVFHFTSETPEDARRANRQGEPEWEFCRARTREESRGFETHEGDAILKEPFLNVPDIVITNYSMLEYMLCRPQDSRFFGPDLKYIILDEAHLYSGALAAEIMMLLRRVRERCNVSPDEIIHIATSATLGGTDANLQYFASSLFSSDMKNTFVINGRFADHDLGQIESAPENPPEASEVAKYVDLDFATLTSEDELIDDDQEIISKLRNIITKLISADSLDRALRKHPATPSHFLYASLRESPLIRKMADVLTKEKGSVLSLDDLASRLFNGSINANKQNATIVLLRLAAAARLHASDLPLVPHRLHFLVRAPEGLSVCLNPECSGPDERRISTIGCLQPLGDSCRYCAHILLPVNRCDNCGEWTLSVYENQETSTLEPGYYAKSAESAESAELRTFYLLIQPRELGLVEVIVDTKSGEIRGHGASGVSLWKAPSESNDSKVQCCPTCHSSWASTTGGERQPEWRRTCRSLTGGGPFALSVTAETLLHDLPTYRGTSCHWKPSEGRRLLAFSDSRASAARLGPLLTQQHEMQVVRAAMSRCVKDLTPAGTTDYLASEINRLEKQLSSADLTPDLKRHLQSELADKRVKLRQSRVGTSFSDYAVLLSDRSELAQILDRDTAEQHNSTKYGQSDWERNRKEIQAHTEGLIANELERPLKKRASVESVGLIEIVYPGIENLDIPPLFEERLPSNTRQKIAEVWSDFVALLLDASRRNSCVAWTQERSGQTWLGESPLLGRWLTRSRGGWGATAFVGATVKQFRRSFAANMLHKAGCSDDQLENLSEEILFSVFDQLFQMADDNAGGLSWLRNEPHHQTGPEESDKAIQIQLDRLSVRSPAKLYRCEATGTLWTHSALGWAPIEGCLGTLKSITHEELDNDARWGRSRREYKESPIFSVGLWAEEHSAQLSPQENRRLQDLFKTGIRNILSSTTTMELGIDIGGLNGVLLGNVPPGPANHRQRAGRAGRRSDGSAVVVTYSRDSEYDREVFRRFGEFLKRELRKPTVFLDRERIIRRHLHAVLLSEFLRSQQPFRTGAMHAYGRMGAFCGVNTPLRWKHATDPKPSWSPNGINVADEFLKFLHSLQTNTGGLQARLSHLSENTILSEAVHSEKWIDFIESTAENFCDAIKEWNDDIGQLRDAWNEISSQPASDISRKMAKANSIRYMIRALCEITVIEWLADRRFLPRYGFPINLQRLSIRKAIEGSSRDYSEPDERYRLERSSLLALSEYVPESRVLVGGRVATSRGLRKHWTDSNLDEALGLQYFSLECPAGHVYVHQSPDETCPRCGSNPSKKQQLVFPRFGYTTAGWEKLPLGTNLERIGEQSVCPTAFAEHGEGLVTEDFANISGARVIYREEAPLLVRNFGRCRCGFVICTRCGFAMSEVDYGQGRMNLPRNFEAHASVFSSNPRKFCWKKGEQTVPVLRNRVLAARELTDMTLLEWPGATTYRYNGVYSFGRALLLAGARLLELDERELGMELMPLRDTNLGIVIYDTAPGGAGHCQELINLGEEWIEVSREILYVDEEHHSRCKKACLDCILDFSGQYSSNRLDRLSALTLFDDAIS